MATLDQIAQALQAADAAGDTQAAQQLAQAYQQMKSAAPPDNAATSVAPQQQSMLSQAGDIGKQMLQSGGRMLVNAATGVPRIMANGVAGGANVVADAVGAKRPFPVMPGDAMDNALSPVLGQRPDGVGGIAEDVGSAVIGGKLPLPGVNAAASPAAQAAASSTRNAQVATLAQEGVRLDSSQALGGKLPLVLKNAANDGAFGSSQAFQDAQHGDFTNAALRQMGVSGNEALPSVMEAGRQVLKNNYNAIAARTNLSIDNGLNSDIGSIRYAAQRSLTPDNARVIENQLDDIESMAAANGGKISGPGYQKLQSALSDVSNDSGKAPFIAQIRQALTGALSRQASPEDVQLLNETNQKYGAMKAIEKAITVKNQVSPSLLYNAMDTQKGANQSVFGQGPNSRLMDLAQAGKSILGDNTPNSGTPTRLAGLTAVAAPLAAGGAIMSGHPDAALGALATIAVPGISQQAAKALIYSPGGRQWLMNWAKSSAGMAALAKAALPTSGAGAVNAAAAGVNRSAGMQPLPGGGQGIPPETF